MPLTDPSLERLAAAIERIAGVVASAARGGTLARAVEERRRALAVRDTGEYVDRLLEGALAGEWPRLLAAVTVKESYCFRGPRQLEAFAAHVLPEIAAARGAIRRVRLWSAGCARGEEPATLAILLAEHLGLEGWDWRIHGTDIDREALEAARRFRFPERAVRRVPASLLRRYFRREGEAFVLDPRLAARIELAEMNLVAEPFAPPACDLDAIFLRNVLIYFRPESQRRVVRNMARCLAPHGRLVLGPAEVLWHRCEELEVEDLGAAFFYRRRRPRAPRQPAVPPPAPAATPGPGGGARETPSAGERRRSPAPPAAAVETVVAALEDGRLDEARASLARAGGAAMLDPSLHVLRGLVAEAEGDADGAVAAYRAALYLEPRLFQARLLLAEVLLAAGSADRARRELLRVLEDVPAGIELPWAASLALPDRARAAARARRLLIG